MHRIVSILLATGLSFGASPSAAHQDSQELRPAQPKSSRAANKKTLAKMQGAWQLTDVRLIDADKTDFGGLRLEHSGYAVVSGRYIAIEFHFRLTEGETADLQLGPNQTASDRGRSLATGVHKMEMQNGEEIETTSLIGTTIGRFAAPEFEPPGTKRIYHVDITGDTMVLTRDDGHTLTFERMIDDEQSFDIFGRPVKDDDAADETKDAPPVRKRGGGR